MAIHLSSAEDAFWTLPTSKLTVYPPNQRPLPCVCLVHLLPRFFDLEFLGIPFYKIYLANACCC